MWRRVEIRNYRSIEKVSVDLAPFTLLVGPNGSGKSNFADALVFVRDVATDAAGAVARRNGIGALRRRGADSSTAVTVDIRAASTARDLKRDYVRHRLTIVSEQDEAWSFRRERIELITKGDVTLRLRRDRDGLTAEPAKPLPGNYATWLGDLDATASAMLIARQNKLIARHKALQAVRRIRPDVEAMRQFQEVSSNKRLDESGKNIAAAYQSLDEEERHLVLLAMRHIVPDLIKILVDELDGTLLLRFTQRMRGGALVTFRASAMSEGALRALAILVAAQQVTTDELLIIEEPETAIHVAAAQLLFEMLKSASRRGAVLVTTHSADLLDAAQDEEILVCSYDEGITKIGPLASSQRALVKEGLFSLGEIMRAEPLRIEGEPTPVVGP